ncbi:MAG: BamA/TamA family outer membrane protein [Candidatus Zixiibacteriota bacterium]
MRVFSLIFAALLVCAFCSNIAAERLPVRIVSNGEMRLIASIIGDVHSPEAVVDKMQRAGYFDVEASVIDDTLIVNPGERYIFGEFSIRIVRHDGTVESRVESGWRGQAATAENIDAAKQVLLREFQEAGHYFASLQTESVKMNAGRIEFSFKIITGPAVVIEQVRFKGLKKSRRDFMTALTGIKPGVLLTSELLRNAVRKIRTQDYLYIDSTPQITPSQTYESVELSFFIEEGPRNIIELGGGYLPSQAGQNGQFVGKIDYRLRNPFGAGRKIRFLFDKRDRNISILDFEYAQPVFIPQYLEITGSVNQTDYDSLYHSFTAEAGLSLMSGENTRISSTFSWTKTEPEFSSQEPTRIIRGTFGFAVSSLNDEFNPAAGASIDGNVAYIRRTAWPDGSSTQVVNNESSFALAFTSIFKMYRSLQYGLCADAGVLLTSRDLIPYSEQFKLGGFGSLRGYRQDQFAGRRTALVQQELIFRATGKAAVYLFGDFGYVYARKKGADQAVHAEETTRFGTGAGFRFGTRTARLTFEIGWGKGDSAGDGKVHVGLQTAF